MSRLVLAVLLLLLPVSAHAQTIMGGFLPPAGGGTPVGGSCGTANALGKFTASTTLGCSAVIDNAGAVSGVTTLSVTDQLTSTLAIGTPPFVVTSTTVVPNLNAGLLNGATFAAPGVIGGTTPASITGTTLKTGAGALTLTTGAIGMNTMTASASAPGAGGAKFEVVCGTNAGTVKLVMYGGTSGTAVTVVDNVGGGVSGC